MTEVVFLKENAEKWRNLEAVLAASKTADPDQLAILFQEITDDLSYSQTFYPGSRTTQYLNGLASQLHQQIYRNQKEEQGRIRQFWSRDLPLLFTEVRIELLVSLLVMLLAISIGVISGDKDESFVRLILGDGYVNMTLENIEQGDPMGVYKKANQVDMFLGIIMNNIRVSLFAFVAGLFFSLGTVIILFQNGVMLGAFQQFFYRHDLLGQSFLTVYVHGALEIPAIIIAGAAGLCMGNSILFPGTYSRLQSFRIGAKKGAQIIIGLVPVFITAGFLEGFVTRYTDMPLLLNLTIIFGSLTFIIWYVIYYPIQLKRSLP